MTRTTARFTGLKPASTRASEAARSSSMKSDTRCELLLRRELWKRGLRYRVDVRDLPGRPDIVFAKARLVVFCDGDFWHGRNWEERRQKLSRGHNAHYWLKKIGGNIDRDRRNTAELEAAGWTVLRFWETEIREELSRATETVIDVIAAVNMRAPPIAKSAEPRSNGSLHDILIGLGER